MTDPSQSSGDLETEFTYTVIDDDDGVRLDKLLAMRFTELSRARLKSLILDSQVSINNIPCDDPSKKVRLGMTLRVNVPEPEDDTPTPEKIDLDILFEDDDMLVINKQTGLVVHPGAGNRNGTLVNGLLYHCGDSLSGIGGVRRPGIVHRLDKETSGLMVVAKSDKAHKKLSSQLSDRSLGRHYKAFLWGVPSLGRGVVDQPIGRHQTSRIKMAVNRRNGRSARTHYKVFEQYGDAASLVDCKLESGRTHQVRVHMAFVKHPLIGDPLYGIQENAAQSLLRKSGFEEPYTSQILSFSRQALQAWKIEFIHPINGEQMSFEVPMPTDLANLQKALKTVA